jgi:hypothetical protein
VIPAVLFLASLESAGPDPYLEIAVLLSPLMAGAATAGGWVAIRLAGRPRPSADWIDRLGVGIGWFWILIAPVCLWILMH